LIENLNKKEFILGYHIIIRENDNIKHKYVEKYIDIAEISDLKEDSIIYEGEPHWLPVLIKNEKKYKNFLDAGKRSGYKAQKLFVKQAVNENLMLEELKQDQESFIPYTKVAKDVSIKRGDYLIRNVLNIEVDVKCRKIHTNENSVKYFKIEYHELKKLENMEQFTMSPIYLAVYARDGDNPVPESLMMISIKEIFQLNREGKIGYNKATKYSEIPVEYCKKGFEAIADEAKSISIRIEEEN
jgi:hypothetical protein